MVLDGNDAPGAVAVHIFKSSSEKGGKIMKKIFAKLVCSILVILLCSALLPMGTVMANDSQINATSPSFEATRFDQNKVLIDLLCQNSGTLYYLFEEAPDLTIGIPAVPEISSDQWQSKHFEGGSSKVYISNAATTMQLLWVYIKDEADNTVLQPSMYFISTNYMQAKSYAAENQIKVEFYITTAAEQVVANSDSATPLVATPVGEAEADITDAPRYKQWEILLPAAHETYRFSAVGHNESGKTNIFTCVTTNSWGSLTVINNISHYTSDDGTTSVPINNNDITWLQEESQGTSVWYGLNNSDNTFERGSRFWVRWLYRNEAEDGANTADGRDFEQVWALIDESHRKEINPARARIFLVGVTSPDGTPYTHFDQQVPLYVQIGNDWNKEDIEALFISDNRDEEIKASFQNDCSYPDKEKVFGVMTLGHFSAYVIYEKQVASEEDENSKQEQQPSIPTEDDSAQGEQPSPPTGQDPIFWLPCLFVVSGCVLLFLRKYRLQKKV